eukprot:COSAG06_NODE_2071_length_7666_cov_12.184353_4_plen_256_part_00
MRSRVGTKNCDLSNQFDHIIWAGDLNYRQEKREWWAGEALLEKYKAIEAVEQDMEGLAAEGKSPPELAAKEAELAKLQDEAAKLEVESASAMDESRYSRRDKAKVLHEEKLDNIKRLMANRDWQELEANDELRREMGASRAFAGFTDSLDWEGDVGGRGMIPTFKMQRKKIWSNLSQRVPSFCDRVLYRSAPGAAECLKLDTFSAAPSLVTSDHKPVFARFKLTVPPSMPETVDRYLSEHRPKDGDAPVTFAAIR